MEIIASADNNWGIGKDGDLLFTVPEDMRRFKSMTVGNIVIMGKATCLSLPKGPLPDRENVVLSRSKDFCPVGFTLLGSTEELDGWLKENRKERKVFVIGGEMLYRELLGRCEKAHITRFHSSFEADRFLPDLDADPNWELAEKENGGIQKGVAYDFCTYVRKSI